MIGALGADCNAACNEQGLRCNPHIVTRDSNKALLDAGLPFCMKNGGTDTWFADDQPGYVGDSSDANYYRCIGFKGVPDSVPCDGNHFSVQRLCACDNIGSSIVPTYRGLYN